MYFWNIVFSSETLHHANSLVVSYKGVHTKLNKNLQPSTPSGKIAEINTQLTFNPCFSKKHKISKLNFCFVLDSCYYYYFFLNFNKLQIKNFVNLEFINLSTGPLKLPSKTLQQLQAEQKTNLLQCWEQSPWAVGWWPGCSPARPGQWMCPLGPGWWWGARSGCWGR